MDWTTLILVIFYFAVILFLGFKMSSFVKTSEDYIVAGRNLGFLTFMMLVVASVMSGMTVLGASGLSYVAGWPSIWEPIFVCLSVAITMVLFGPKLYRLGRKFKYNSIQDYLAQRYESPKAVRAVAAVAAVLISLIYLVGQLRAISIVLGWLLGLSEIWALVIASVVVTFYVILGGLYAVAYTTLVQGLALLIGSVVLIPVVIQSAGGLSYINERLAEINPSFLAVAYPQVHPPAAGNEFLTPFFLVSFFFLLTFGLSVAPHAINNVLTARNSRYFKWAPVWAFAVYFLAFLFIKVGGFAARVLSADGLVSIPHPDYALIVAIEHALPTMAWSFFAVVVLAAVMSTTDRLLLTIGSLCSWDIYRNLFKPDASDDSVRNLSRIMVLVAGVIAFLLAIRPPALLAWLIWMGIGLMLSTFCVPLLAGLYWRRATSWAGLLSMLVGLLTAVITGYMHQYVSPLPVHFSIFGLGASFVTMIIVSFATPATTDKVLKETETGIGL